MQGDIFGCALGLVAPWFIKKIEFDATLKKLLFTLISRQAAGLRFMVSLAQCMIQKLKLGDIDHRVRTDYGRMLLVLPPWAGKIYGFSLLFESLIAEPCCHMPIPKWQKW